MKEFKKFVLVTGSLGFIGKKCVEKLLASNCGVTECDSRRGCKVTCFTNYRHFDEIYHLASLTNVIRSISFPLVTISENVSNLLAALEMARDSHSRFIFTSSMNSPSRLSPYLASKSACEAICEGYRNSYDLDVNILRLSNVYGPGSWHKTSVVSTLIKQILNFEPLTIYGKDVTRDFVYVDDVVSAMVTLSRGTKLLRIGSGISTSLGELVEILRSLTRKYLDYEPYVKFVGKRKGEVETVTPETDLDRVTSLEHGLDETFKWFIKERDAKKFGQ